jgi:hypothetical protein
MHVCEIRADDNLYAQVAGLLQIAPSQIPSLVGACAADTNVSRMNFAALADRYCDVPNSVMPSSSSAPDHDACTAAKSRLSARCMSLHDIADEMVDALVRTIDASDRLLRIDI